MSSTAQNYLISRRDTLAARLASLPAAADSPTLEVDGQKLDWAAAKQAMLEELKQLNEMIGISGGPWEVDS